MTSSAVGLASSKVVRYVSLAGRYSVASQFCIRVGICEMVSPRLANSLPNAPITSNSAIEPQNVGVWSGIAQASAPRLQDSAFSLLQVP